MKIIFFITFLFLCGCASSPLHLYGTEKDDIKNLSSITDKTNEVRILEVDDKAFTGKHGEYFYLAPGIHKFTALLSWDDMLMVGNVPITTYSSSPYVRSGCLTMEPGKQYLLAASDSSKDWHLMVFKSLIGKHEVSPCSPSTATIPDWLKVKLNSITNRSIYHIEYNKQSTYYISSACCDIPSDLYSKDGELICHPDGGLAGGDGKCPGFVFIEGTPSKIWPVTK
ncbi:MAG TPA: hypothetical protein VK954_07225 [Methyloradius sp.]|nr:hypothetical protein [Methyloradius sp.]